MAAGIYVHIPFCRQKCLYCDFVSGYGSIDEMERYQKSLLAEIKSTDIKESVDTVFFGGGTPSVYPTEYIEEILTLFRKKNVFMRENLKQEITIEANPGTLTEEKLISYKQAGINRLSIGLQSANNKELKTLGRIHDYEQFAESYTLARKAGFNNINIDLMSAIPKQSIASYADTLEKVIALEPEHISAYSLIIEEGTPFYEKYHQGGKGCAVLPDEEEEREMYYLTKRELEKNGYYRYEISNYAKKGYECKHNLKYWNRDSYYGFGLSAASLVRIQGENLRYTNTADRKEYEKIREKDTEIEKNNEISKTGKISNISEIRSESFTLSKQEQIEEFMYLGLRKTDGVSKESFKREFQEDIESIYEKQIKELADKELLINEKDRIYLTDRGIDVSNIVLAEFLLD